MKEIELDPAVRKLAVQALRDWLLTELDQELSEFQAGLLLDFTGERIGGLWYNAGLLDARALFERRVEEIGESIHELERAPAFDVR